MTSLIAWIGADNRGPASAYFASDSRLTWPGERSWDHGRKLFACRHYPHILGYCGDVLFPTQTLGQIAEMIDADLLVRPDDDVEACTERVLSVMTCALRTYPDNQRQAFQVLYGMRSGTGVASRFNLRRIDFDAAGLSGVSAIDVPRQSAVVEILGTGTAAMKGRLQAWQASDAGGTSRAVFSAFCDSVASGEDPRSGGPPQLVGLWRQHAARTFGIIWQRRRYFYGTESDPSAPATSIHWYNELFEICDPRTLARRDDAQPQPRPRGL